ncbi:MAG TPA: hypothetical protein VGA49_00390 [Patescibacteria group bacterium]
MNDKIKISNGVNQTVFNYIIVLFLIIFGVGLFLSYRQLSDKISQTQVVINITGSREEVAEKLEALIAENCTAENLTECTNLQILGYAVSTGDTRFCESITDQAFKNQCLDQPLFKQVLDRQDILLCDQALDAPVCRAAYNYDIAVKTGNRELCNQFSEDIQARCLEAIATAGF